MSYQFNVNSFSWKEVKSYLNVCTGYLTMGKYSAEHSGSFAQNSPQVSPSHSEQKASPGYNLKAASSFNPHCLCAYLLFTPSFSPRQPGGLFAIPS